jgi:hypothetical protein
MSEAKMEAELLPCPFCGNDNIEIIPNGIGDYYAICSGDGEDGDPCGCGASTSDRRCESQEGAVDRWNARAASSELQRENQRLREALGHYANTERCECGHKKGGHVVGGYCLAGECTCGGFNSVAQEALKQEGE